MSLKISELPTTTLKNFRDFAIDIRKPKAYHLGVTELKGSINLIIGIGQLAVCPYFKFMNNRRLYAVHTKAGEIAIKQGVKDLAPAIKVTALVVATIAAHQLIQI